LESIKRVAHQENLVKDPEKRTSAIPLERISGLNCPYHGAFVVCNASLFRLTPSASVKAAFCNTDHYDHCPLFVAKVQRKKWSQFDLY